jgi:hypothetical protein
MRAQLVSILLAALVVSVEPAKGKKSRREPFSKLDVIAGKLTSITNQMAMEHGKVDKTFRDFCTYFLNFPREVREAELVSFTFITQFYCNLLPVLDAQVSEITSIVEENRSMKRPIEHETLRMLTVRAYEFSVDGQQMVMKIIEAFPSLTEGAKEIGTHSSVFAIKIRAFKKVIPPFKQIWIRMTQEVYSILDEIQPQPSAPEYQEENSSSSNQITEESTTTTEESTTATTTEESKDEEVSAIVSTESRDALTEALRETFLKAIQVRDDMSSFLHSFGTLRKAIGNDPAVIERLNSLLVFPTNRAVAWENFLKDFASFASSLDPPTSPDA